MAKPYYEFFCPVKVIAGNAALEHIPFELATLGAKRPMIITDKGVRANGLLSPIEAAFSTTDAVIGAIFDDVPPDSSLEVVRAAAQLYREKNVMRLLRLVVVRLLIHRKQLIF
jgi:alcohol dehydrogenase